MTEPEVYVLMDERERRHLVLADGGMARVPGLGVLSIEKLRGSLGRRLVVGDRSVLVLPANRRDRMEGLDRKAQVIGPKDAAAILFHGDIGPGSLVVEAGAGSAWLTVALASAVGAQGRVISYEERPDFAGVAEENLRRAGLLGRVTLRVADISLGIPDHDVDAVVLDLPDPWTAIDTAWKALRIGGGPPTLPPPPGGGRPARGGPPAGAPPPGPPPPVHYRGAE